MGPPYDSPIPFLEDLRLDRAPPTATTHKHIPFLKVQLKLSTQPLPSDTLYNKDLIDKTLYVISFRPAGKGNLPF